MDQLKKKGFSLASRCPFCGQAEEVLEHLFIHCPKICGLRTALFSLSENKAERANSWLGSPPLEEKKNKTVASSSSVLIVGNLDGDEQNCV